MVFRGILAQSFGSFLCLRGFASLRDLAECSISDKNYQRPKVDEHIDEIVEFLNDVNNLFFPEVILGISLDEWGVTEDEYNWLYNETSSEKGVSQKRLGDLVISTFAKRFTKSPREAPIYTTMSVYGIDSSKNSKLYRIDGNHRLEAALSDGVSQKVLNRVIPYCLLFFRDKIKYKENASTIFRNINFKVRPILEEYNLKNILEDESVFPDSTLNANPAYGKHFVWARKLYRYLEEHESNLLAKTYADSPCTFFIRILEIVASRNIATIFSKSEPSDDEMQTFVARMESALCEPSIMQFTLNLPIAEALVYYKIKSNGSSEYDKFCEWLNKNNFSSIDAIKAIEIVNIFDEIYRNIPKQLFLARWYPQDGKEKRKADARYAAIKRLADKFGLRLIDMEHEIGGTFAIRDLIDQKIPESDLFIADLTGTRPNVMIEVGMALHHIKNNRVLFCFQKSGEVNEIPFDLTGFRREEIVDSSELESQLSPHIAEILNSSL